VLEPVFPEQGCLTSFLPRLHLLRVLVLAIFNSLLGFLFYLLKNLDNPFVGVDEAFLREFRVFLGKVVVSDVGYCVFNGVL